MNQLLLTTDPRVLSEQMVRDFEGVFAQHNPQPLTHAERALVRSAYIALVRGLLPSVPLAGSAPTAG
jgi:hypothetical protein